jgi:hypothetical protein
MSITGGRMEGQCVMLRKNGHFDGLIKMNENGMINDPFFLPRELRI